MRLVGALFIFKPVVLTFSLPNQNVRDHYFAGVQIAALKTPSDSVCDGTSGKHARISLTIIVGTVASEAGVDCITDGHCV